MRQARCTMCGKVADADNPREELAFFEERGPTSRFAADNCKCGFARIAHDRPLGFGERRRACTAFEPRGAHEFDAYYCGCRGWD